MGRLDYYDIRPAGLDAYLSYYGYHFSPAMARWAVSKMKPRSGGSFDPLTREAVTELLTSQKVDVINDIAYDAVYAANMIKSNRWGSSVRDEAQLALAIKDELDDPDGYEGQAFTRFLADCNGKGIPIMWEDVI